MKKTLAVFTVEEFKAHIARQLAQAPGGRLQLTNGAHPSLVRTPRDKGFNPEPQHTGSQTIWTTKKAKPQ